MGILVILSIGFLIFGFFLPKLFRGLNNDKIEIVYWGLKHEPTAILSIISEFEEKNPQIKIIYSNQDINQYRERLLGRIENKTGPDVFRFHNTWISMLSDVLMPLPEDIITKDDFSKNYYQVTKKNILKKNSIF